MDKSIKVSSQKKIQGVNKHPNKKYGTRKKNETVDNSMNDVSHFNKKSFRFHFLRFKLVLNIRLIILTSIKKLK